MRAELYIPPSDRYKKESNDARKLIFEVVRVYLEIVTIAVVVAYTSVAAFQWWEMRKATKASADTAETAVIALDENKWQFRNSLAEIQRQTKAQQDAATASLIAAKTAEKQWKFAESEAAKTEDRLNANLLIKNFKIDHGANSFEDKAKITFNLYNDGSVASQITETSGRGVYEYSLTRDQNLAETAKVPTLNPTGYPLEKGGLSEIYTIDASGWIATRQHGHELTVWNRIAHMTISGKIKSVCVLVVGSKGGLGAQPCLPIQPR